MEKILYTKFQFSLFIEAKINVYCTHTVKRGYNVQYLVQIYLYRGEKKENYFVSHSFPTRLMTTLLCSTALRIESLSLQSHSCNQSIKWEKDEIMCK